MKIDILVRYYDDTCMILNENVPILSTLVIFCLDLQLGYVGSFIFGLRIKRNEFKKYAVIM